MDYKKYINYLEEKYKKIFTFSREIALKRDNKLIEGFIDKAIEEISFNDFYVSGNENILKYSGVVIGLEEKKYPYFQQTTSETKKKLEAIRLLSSEMTSKSDEYNDIFQDFKSGAEYCLNDFIEEKMKYYNLNQRTKLLHILDSAKAIANSEQMTIKTVMEFKKLVEEGEKCIENIKSINEALESETYVKKNAYYAVKNFYWLQEKGTFDKMSETQKQVYLSKKLVKEYRAKAELLFNELNEDNDSNEKVNYVIA